MAYFQHIFSISFSLMPFIFPLYPFIFSFVQHIVLSNAIVRQLGVCSPRNDNVEEIKSLVIRTLC